MRKFILVIVCLVCLLQACKTSYVDEYYERISGIKIPINASVIETFDNGEFLTVTSFKVTPKEIKELTSQYHFKPVDGSFVPGFMGNYFLKGISPAKSDLNKCLMIGGENGKAFFTYVLDTSKQLLWAEISYPDWGGK